MKLYIEDQATGKSFTVEAKATDSVAQLHKSVESAAAQNGIEFVPDAGYTLLYQMKLPLEDDQTVDLARLENAREVKLSPHAALEENVPQRNRQFVQDDMILILRETDELKAADSQTLEDFDIYPEDVILIATGSPDEAAEAAVGKKRKERPEADKITITINVPVFDYQIQVDVNSNETYQDVKQRVWKQIESSGQKQLGLDADDEEGSLPTEEEIDSMSVDYLRVLCKDLVSDIQAMRGLSRAVANGNGNAESDETITEPPKKQAKIYTRRNQK